MARRIWFERCATSRGWKAVLGLGAFVLACSGSNADSDGKQDAASDAAGAGGSGGQTTGPCSGSTCSETEFCDWNYDWCIEQQTGTHGSCRPRNGSCVSDPVCGCDGTVYLTECAAHAAGVDIAGALPGGNRCSETPVGTFPCGPWFCNASISYCRYREGDSGDRQVECRALPATCNGAGSCACLPPPSLGKCMTVQGNGVAGVLLLEWSQ